MSFIRKGKDKESHINKRGVSARQKSTDSGISSNRDTHINSDENLPDSSQSSYGLNKTRPCSTIKVVRNNSHIQTTNTGKVCGGYNNATKRTQSTLGARGKTGRPNINVKRSNTSIGTSAMGMNRGNRHNNIGHTSDSSTSSTGYISDHRNRNNQSNYRDRDNNNYRDGKCKNGKSKYRDETSASESSSEEYTSSDNSSYTSDDSNPRRNIKKKKKAAANSNNHKNKKYKNVYQSDEDDTSLAATSIADSHRYSDEDERDKEEPQKAKDASPQLEAIPEGEEEEERCQQDRRRHDQNVSNRRSLQVNSQNSNQSKYTQNRNINSRKPMHSYHGNSPDFHENEDYDECLLKEAGKRNISNGLPPKPGRSHSSDATNSNNNLRQNNWRTPRKSFGENQIRSLPPHPETDNKHPKERKISQGGGVRALVNKIQTQTESQDDDIPNGYGLNVSNSGYTRKYSRGTSRDGNLSEDHPLDLDLNDDPLYEPTPETQTVRRAGMAQNREGRAYLSRKNSFNSTKQAKESGRMGDHEQDLAEENATETERPRRGATVQRSTSRVKMMAQSLQQRETAVKKHEEMIANHQPLAETAESSRSKTNLAEEKISNSGSPASNRRAPSAKEKPKEKQTPKNDDSFIKELLEIARAESQEKQKGPEITFTTALLKNSSPTPPEDKSTSSVINDNTGNTAQYIETTCNADETRTATNSNDTERPSSIRKAGDKPKDFKDAIAIASTRIANKKNSKDCSLERELDGADQDHSNTDNTNDCLLDDQDNLIHEIKNPAARTSFQNERELPYSTVTSVNMRRRSRLSQDQQKPPTGGRHSLSSTIGERAKMFEHSGNEPSSHGTQVPRNRASPSRAASFSHANIYNNNKPQSSYNHNQHAPNKTPVHNQCSSSSGIYSGNPDEDYHDHKSPGSSDYTESVRNHKQYYDNLVNRVKNLNPANKQPDGRPPIAARDPSPRRSSSPVKSSIAAFNNSGQPNPSADPKAGTKTRIVKKKKIIRKVRTSRDCDPAK